MFFKCNCHEFWKGCSSCFRKVFYTIINLQSHFNIFIFEGILGNAFAATAFMITIFKLPMLLLIFFLSKKIVFRYYIVYIGYNTFSLLIKRDYSPSHRVNSNTFSSI